MSIRILCVDKENNDQGTIAQAYLEILRLASRNNSRNAFSVFREVASAGSNIETSFTRANCLKGVKLSSSTQAKHDNTSLRALDYKLPDGLKSDEANHVLARVASRKIQGITFEHLQNWDYIICFRTSVNVELKRLKDVLITNVIKNAAKIPGLTKPKADIWQLPAAYSPDPQQNAMNTMKAINIWAHDRLQYKGSKWVVPTNIRGKWRSKQILIPEAQYFALLANGSNEWNAIHSATGCYLLAGPHQGEMRLITITGDRSHLASVAERIEKFWL